jgi:transposase
VKVLWWDKNGFCLLYKRLHRALFKLPDGEGPRLQLDARAFAELLAGVAREKTTSRCNRTLTSKLH